MVTWGALSWGPAARHGRPAGPAGLRDGREQMEMRNKQSAPLAETAPRRAASTPAGTEWLPVRAPSWAAADDEMDGGGAAALGNWGARWRCSFRRPLFYTDGAERPALSPFSSLPEPLARADGPKQSRPAADWLGINFAVIRRKQNSACAVARPQRALCNTFGRRPDAGIGPRCRADSVCGFMGSISLRQRRRRIEPDGKISAAAQPSEPTRPAANERRQPERVPFFDGRVVPTRGRSYSACCRECLCVQAVTRGWSVVASSRRLPRRQRLRRRRETARAKSQRQPLAVSS
jgi:hypothetical protein